MSCVFLSLQGCQLENSTGFITIQASFSTCLKNLDLRFVHGDASKIFSRALPRMRQLEALGLDNIPSCCSAMFHFLCNLKVFYCQNCASITDEDLEGLGINCHELESLSLSGCAYITGKFLPGLVRGCRKLKTLLLSCTRIRNQYIRETNWTDAMVTELDISYCYGITEEGLLVLLPSLTQLKYLQISFCGWGRALSDNVIAAMASHIGQSLETLDIHSSFNLSGHALCSLLDKCPSMTTLCVGSAINSDVELECSLQCLPKLKNFFITKQSIIKTETVFNLISKYCKDIEVLALYNFYAINRPKVEESLVNLVRTCTSLKTLCVRGTNVPLRTELAALAAMAKVVSGRRDINICRTPHMLLSGPMNSLDNVIRAEFKITSNVS
ncbi:dynein regulatory complex subunit 6-like [Exaiptasia diaphana]|uniref:Uncharacterized protein n=1 Tax=Exaiptasia diaphana TaxID=2652724 RepID=A0A913XHA5_EXADI|nr:dynein regulatory complex subunit 6-like [Exaiptasia diaphana]